MDRTYIFVRVMVSLGLLVGLAVWLDMATLVSRLASIRPPVVLLAIGISVLQVVVLAWRWRFTALKLGVRLSFTMAWREYYLSIFLNQVLPGGVMGEVSRAWRQVWAQNRIDEPGGPAVRAVIFERLSAQVVMTTVAVVSLLALPATISSSSRFGTFAAGTAAVFLIAIMILWFRRQSAVQPLLRRVIADLVTTHLSLPVFTVQFVSAIIVVGTYLATYVLAARVVGVEVPLPVLLPLVAPVLMTMLIPVTVAGWGLREGGAALLWGAVGLTAADGVVVSVTYGLLVLVGSLPGAVVLVMSPSR